MLEVALHRVSEYIKMRRERLAAEVPRQAIKTARKLQERRKNDCKHPTEPTTVNASDDEYIDYNPIKDRQIKFFLAGMGITAGCLAILAVAYAIGKKSAQKKAEKEKNHNDNTLENKTSDD